MNVAVTGGSGQLGTVLIRQLLSDRSISKILVLDVRPPSIASAKLQFIRADVRDQAFHQHLQGIDTLFHFAFLVTQPAIPGEFQSVNIDGSKNVFRAALAANVKTVIYASSVAAYGVVAGHPDPIVEDTPRKFQPEFPYSACKYQVEAFLDEFEPAHPEMAICRLRPVVLAGQHMEHGMGRMLSAGLVVDLGGPPIPLVWDEDVAKAAILAMKQRARGPFVLTANQQLPAPDFAKAAGMRRISLSRNAAKRLVQIATLLGAAPKADPSWLEVKPVHLHYSSKRAIDQLGWKPKYPTGLDVAKALGAAAHGSLDPRLRFFFLVAPLAGERAAAMNPEAQRLSAEIHLQLLGKGGGDFTFSISRGRLSIHPGIPRPPTSVLILKASALIDLLAGNLALGTAQLTGKVRTEGDPLAVMVLSGIVTLFRKQATSKQPAALPARLIAKWMGDKNAI